MLNLKHLALALSFPHRFIPEYLSFFRSLLNGQKEIHLYTVRNSKKHTGLLVLSLGRLQRVSEVSILSIGGSVPLFPPLKKFVAEYKLLLFIENTE